MCSGGIFTDADGNNKPYKKDKLDLLLADGHADHGEWKTTDWAETIILEGRWRVGKESGGVGAHKWKWVTVYYTRLWAKRPT